LRIAQSGELLLFGARHTSDLQDPQIAKIERLWREFRPQAAFSEGGFDLWHRISAGLSRDTESVGCCGRSPIGPDAAVEEVTS
jgi:hypothetical protein